jgi:hypothetical protein
MDPTDPDPTDFLLPWKPIGLSRKKEMVIQLVEPVGREAVGTGLCPQGRHQPSRRQKGGHRLLEPPGHPAAHPWLARHSSRDTTSKVKEINFGFVSKLQGNWNQQSNQLKDVHFVSI